MPGTHSNPKSRLTPEDNVTWMSYCSRNTQGTAFFFRNSVLLLLAATICPMRGLALNLASCLTLLSLALAPIPTQALAIVKVPSSLTPRTDIKLLNTTNTLHSTHPLIEYSPRTECTRWFLFLCVSQEYAWRSEDYLSEETNLNRSMGATSLRSPDSQREIVVKLSHNGAWLRLHLIIHRAE